MTKPALKVKRLKTSNLQDLGIDRDLRDLGWGKSEMVTYHNFTSVPMFVRDRMGAVTTVNSFKTASEYIRNEAKHRHLNMFYVVVHRFLTGQDLHDARGYYQSLSAESSVADQFVRAIDAELKNWKSPMFTHKLEVVISISEDDFFENPGYDRTSVMDSIYIEELGIYVYQERAKTMDAPGDLAEVVKARNNGVNLALVDAADDSALLVIEATDTSGHHQFDKLYIGVCEDVMQIPIRRCNSNDARHGITFRTHPTMDMLRQEPWRRPTEVITTFYTFEDAMAKLGVSTSIEGARSRGDSKRALDLELSNRQAEIKRADLDLQEMQRKNRLEEEEFKANHRKLEQIEKEVTLARTAADNERKEREAEASHERAQQKIRLEQEALRAKTHYDANALERRNFWDTVGNVFKVMLTTLGIVGGIARLLK